MYSSGLNFAVPDTGDMSEKCVGCFTEKEWAGCGTLFEKVLQEPLREHSGCRAQLTGALVKGYHTFSCPRICSLFRPKLFSPGMLFLICINVRFCDSVFFSNAFSYYWH